MSSEAVQAFGREVRRRREALGMSLSALAVASNLTSNYVHIIEEATRPRGVSLDAAIRLAKALGAELPDLLGFRGFEGFDGPAVEAARIVQALPSDLRKAALVVLRALHEEAS